MTSNNVNKGMEVLLCVKASDASNQWEPIINEINEEVKRKIIFAIYYFQAFLYAVGNSTLKTVSHSGQTLFLGLPSGSII